MAVDKGLINSLKFVNRMYTQDSFVPSHLVYNNNFTKTNIRCFVSLYVNMEFGI